MEKYLKLKSGFGKESNTVVFTVAKYVEVVFYLCIAIGTETDFRLFVFKLFAAFNAKESHK
jgi:hypothetical protein